MFTVKVVWKSSGKSVDRGKKVSVSFEGLLRGMSSGHTDSSGEVHFDADPGRGVVYVDGGEVFKGRLEGRVVVYI